MFHGRFISCHSASGIVFVKDCLQFPSLLFILCSSPISLSMWGILVMWLECRFLVTEADGSNRGICMLCPCARHFICIASVNSAVKGVPGGDNLVMDVQCYELFGGIALRNHAFFISHSSANLITQYDYLFATY